MHKQHNLLPHADLPWCFFWQKSINWKRPARWAVTKKNTRTGWPHMLSFVSFSNVRWVCKMSAVRRMVFFPASAYWPVWPGQSTVLSRKRERSCTGPFNWGGAHCAGENVKQTDSGPFLQKSLQQTQTKQQQKRAQPATATRNPPARLPGARAQKQQPKRTQETSKTDPGTP